MKKNLKIFPVFVVTALCVSCIVMPARALDLKNPHFQKKLLRINELEKKTHNLSKLYIEETGNERKAEIKNELRGLLSELFELREEKYNVELKELENQIKEMRKKIEKRKDNKEKIINKRLESLLLSEDYLDW